MSRVSDPRNPEPAVLRADPKLRRTAVALLVAGALLGGTLILALQSHLDALRALADRDPQAAVEQTTFLLAVALAGMAVGLAGLGLYTLWFSLRALRAGTFPPPGTRVVRDTPMYTGPKAIARARMGIALSIAVIVLGVAGPYWVYRTVEMVFDRAATPAVTPGEPY